MDGPANVTPVQTNSGKVSEPLTKRWFGLDWRDHLPWNLCGVSVEYGDLDEALRFIEQWYPQFFGREGRDGWLPDPMRPAKLRFYQDADIFVFRDGRQTVGVEVAHPTDWSSYYIRTHALLPAYRRCGIMVEMVERQSRVLAGFGVQRVEGDVVPANGASIIAQTRAGGVV